MEEVATMRSMYRTYLRASAAGLALLLALGVTAQAADEGISFKKRGDKEKEFYNRVGTAIARAARHSAIGLKPTKIALLKYETKKPKPNRTELEIKMEWYGQIKKKNRYVSDVVLVIDSSDKDNWEVLNI